MDQLASPPPGAALSGNPERRKDALLDILYLLVSLALYIVSLFAPLAGIVLGVTLSNWAGTEETRKVGRACLILGIINIIMYLLMSAIMIAMGGVFSHLPHPNWGGL
jgi:hypothetical protein